MSLETPPPVLGEPEEAAPSLAGDTDGLRATHVPLPQAQPGPEFYFLGSADVCPRPAGARLVNGVYKVYV